MQFLQNRVSVTETSGTIGYACMLSVMLSIQIEKQKITRSLTVTWGNYGIFFT